MDYTTRPRFSRLCTAVTLAVAGTHAGISIAQEPTAPGGVEEITVTGSRIQRTTGFTTPVPVAGHGRRLSTFQPGRTMAEQLDQLPQFYATQSAQRGGGALFGSAGISTLNMRAMGPQRTLVLVDGARVSPADRDGSVHVDNIPTALISQVEVVTGGASAAYGADALAGVVNFRINRNYEGLDMNVGVEATDAGYGDQVDLSVAYGTGSPSAGTSSVLSKRRASMRSTRTRTISAIGSAVMASWEIRAGHPPPIAQPTQRLVLPDVHTTLHSPTGRIGAGANATGKRSRHSRSPV